MPSKKKKKASCNHTWSIMLLVFSVSHLLAHLILVTPLMMYIQLSSPHLADEETMPQAR